MAGLDQRSQTGLWTLREGRVRWPGDGWDKSESKTKTGELPLWAQQSTLQAEDEVDLT